MPLKPTPLAHRNVRFFHRNPIAGRARKHAGLAGIRQCSYRRGFVGPEPRRVQPTAGDTRGSSSGSVVRHSLMPRHARSGVLADADHGETAKKNGASDEVLRDLPASLHVAQKVGKVLVRGPLLLATMQATSAAAGGAGRTHQQTRAPLSRWHASVEHPRSARARVWRAATRTTSLSVATARARHGTRRTRRLDLRTRRWREALRG